MALRASPWRPALPGLLLAALAGALPANAADVPAAPAPDVTIEIMALEVDDKWTTC